MGGEEENADGKSANRDEEEKVAALGALDVSWSPAELRFRVKTASQVMRKSVSEQGGENQE